MNSVEHGLSESDIAKYLAEVRGLILAEIDRIIPSGTRHQAELYDLMRDYPLREAKGLRPALCYAVCRALGGAAEAVLPTAAVLELYHNAFLIHDDVEDGSLLRRDQATLHVAHGVPIAINVGDAMLALCLSPLLDNTRLVGVGKALRILEVIARMARESAEGQALELGWIRRRTWSLEDRDYYRMVHKKTTWYSFLAPMLAGVLIAGADPRMERQLRLLASLMGVAFQIQDDILNLVADAQPYGKECAGDLWEGKHTLMVIALIRRASSRDRAKVEAILKRRRPESVHDNGPDTKSERDIELLRRLITEHGCLDYASQRAAARAERAARLFASVRPALAPSVHADFLAGLIHYLVARNR